MFFIQKCNLGPIRCELTGNRSRQCLGIPYAMAPLGDRRWRPPILPVPWIKTRDATRSGPACYQRGRGVSEDCLYLNVFAPRRVPENASFAVIVYIHGGSYSTGSGSQHNGTTIVEMSNDTYMERYNNQQGQTLNLTLRI